MKILAVLSLAMGASKRDFEPLALAEELATWSLFRRAAVRDVHLQPDPFRVVMILETVDRAEALTLITALPMVRAGILSADIVTLGPWQALEVLFSARALASLPPGPVEVTA